MFLINYKTKLHTDKKTSINQSIYSQNCNNVRILQLLSDQFREKISSQMVSIRSLPENKNNSRSLLTTAK